VSKWNGRTSMVLAAAGVMVVGMTAAVVRAQVPDAAQQKENVRRMLERAIPRRPPGETAPPPSASASIPANQSSTTSTVNGNTYDYDNVELREVIESLGALTGKNFDIDEKVRGKVTLITNTPISPGLAYEVLESILQARGFAMVPSVGGNLIRVVQSRDAVTGNIQTGVGAEVAAIEGYERFQTQLVPVMYGEAGEISQVVSNLISQDEGRVDVYTPTNTIIITTTVTNLRRLLDIIQQVDVPGFEQQIWIRALEYAQASELAAELEQIFGEQGTGSRTPSRPTPSIRTIRPTSTSRTVSRPASSAIIGAEPTLRIVPDERTNSIIVVATKQMIDRVKELVDQLDSSTAWEEQNLHVYTLLNADATEVAELLNQLISGVEPRRAAGARGGQQQAQIQPFEREVNIVAYEVTNSLLVMASPEDYTVLKTIIEKVDTRQKQVFAEAVIMEVKVDDTYAVTVDMSALYESDAIAGSAFGAYAAIANVIAMGPEGLPTGGLIGIIDQGRSVDVLVPGTGVGDVPAEYMTIPSVPAVLTALQTVTDVDVLSAPQLLTTDNVESRIVVGSEVPFITGTMRGLDQPSTYSSVFSQISREDVGITLNFTPQISEGEYVKLELSVTNSAVASPPPGTDVNIVGPTVSKSEIENTIIVKDGYTAIIGGLMSNAQTKGRSKVPLLGDIPVLGFLFRGTTSTTAKRNLVVLITPTIVKSEVELAELTAAHRDTYKTAKTEAFTASNYLKRIFKKVRRPK